MNSGLPWLPSSVPGSYEMKFKNNKNNKGAQVVRTPRTLQQAWLSKQRPMAIYLTTELVAWETEDNKAAVLVVLVELLEAIVLLGKSALGGDVDDENDLVLKVGHGDLLVALVHGLEGEEVGNLGHVCKCVCWGGGVEVEC